MSGWRVFNLALGRPHFILASAGARWHGEVWQGAMKGEVFWGLKALEYGAHARAKIRNPWKVSTPMRLSSLANTGANRRFVRLERARGGAVVLRFQEIVTADLVAALKLAFQPVTSRTTTNQEEERHEEAHERVGGAAEEGQGRGQRGLLGQGDEKGDVRGLRQDAPRVRQQGRKVTAKKKAAKKTAARRKS